MNKADQIILFYFILLKIISLNNLYMIGNEAWIQVINATLAKFSIVN